MRNNPNIHISEKRRSEKPKRSAKVEAYQKGMKQTMDEMNEQGIRRSDVVWVEKAKNLLLCYTVCADLLRLRGYERRRRAALDEPDDFAELVGGDETLWRARMFEIRTLLEKVRNGREKLILYYRYIRGESVEHTADILGVSRRTGYRLHQRGLVLFAAVLRKKKREENP